MIDLVTTYAPLVDEKFTRESKRSLVTNQDYSFDGSHTIKIYKIGTAGMNDYKRSGDANGSRYGTPTMLSATTETLTMRKDRSFTYEIDRLDANETNGTLAAGSSLERQLREVAIPEVDAYTYNEMWTNAGSKADEVTITDANIYDLIVDANQKMDDAEVPETGRVLIVTPAIYLLLKKSKDIVLNTEIGADMRLKGVISNLDGLDIQKISANRLPKNFGFMIAHPCATVAPLKLENYRIHQDPPGISGDLVEGRLAYDAFVLENKAKAIHIQPNKAAEQIKSS